VHTHIACSRRNTTHV